LKIKDIVEVEKEVHRLLVRIDDLKNTPEFARLLESGRGDAVVYNHPKETAAVRRASMDVTRSLAALRRYS
jgi:hypothetical protein